MNRELESFVSYGKSWLKFHPFVQVPNGEQSKVRTHNLLNRLYMNHPFSLLRSLLCGCFTCILFMGLHAQIKDCTFKPPIITIDFGSGTVSDINDVPQPMYSLVWDPCPNDGYYTYTSATSRCFNDDWFTLYEDHTPGDGNGNMMLVNASPEGGIFFHRILNGLKSGTTYGLTAWLMNVCRIGGGCPPLPADILVRLTTPSRKVVMQVRTGALAQTATPRWTPYTALFTVPAGETSLVLTMMNTTTGGCGNDFALDDITIQECVRPEPSITSLAKRAGQAINQEVALKKQVTDSPQVIKTIPTKQQPVKPASRTTLVVQREKETAIPVTAKPVPRPVSHLPIPSILLTRDNPLVKEIETAAGDIKIDLYDNGVVDGDTVSVYHNNQLIVSGAPLSQQPVTFHIRVDAQQPLHELIMVAHNLGSIPPNTSLMIVTAGDKRHEAFISSSEQKNAKVVIRMKE
jgi:hypothetical protein